MDLYSFNQQRPDAYSDIADRTKEVGFTMPSDLSTGTLLRTLAASKPSGKLLELGTGTGLSTCWILDGMGETASLTSIDNDPELLGIARQFLGHDHRLELIQSDGAVWIENNRAEKFDYIFADTWPGKYFQLEEVLAMLHTGGLYIVDDMLPQPNWPIGHAEKAGAFILYLENRADLVLTKLNWATGILVVVKAGE